MANNEEKKLSKEEPAKDEILIEDGEGNQHKMKILFTYHNDERNRDYVFFYDPADPENVIPMIYDDQGNLDEIEDDEEYEEVEEVFNAYQEDPKIEEIKNN